MVAIHWPDVIRDRLIACRDSADRFARIASPDTRQDLLEVADLIRHALCELRTLSPGGPKRPSSRRSPLIWHPPTSGQWTGFGRGPPSLNPKAP